MGVLGLWQILESVGHPIKIDGLEGKRLGVDANIWLYKFIRGFREKDNATSIESHKLGLFNRICKLLFYKIKPVFVFDGPAPVLKRKTLERRQNARTNPNLSKIQLQAMKLLAEHLKQEYPDVDISEQKIRLPEFRSNNLAAAEKLGDEDRALFYLPPPTKQEEEEILSDYDDEEYEIEGSKNIDINSEDFKKMPPELRYEILKDKKQARRTRHMASLPESASDFMNFQLKKLKARREVQEKIEECEKEICGNYTGEMTFRIQSDPNKFMVYTKQKELLKQERETEPVTSQTFSQPFVPFVPFKPEEPFELVIRPIVEPKSSPPKLTENPKPMPELRRAFASQRSKAPIVVPVQETLSISESDSDSDTEIDSEPEIVPTAASVSVPETTPPEAPTASSTLEKPPLSPESAPVTPPLPAPTTVPETNPPSPTAIHTPTPPPPMPERESTPPRDQSTILIESAPQSQQSRLPDSTILISDSDSEPEFVPVPVQIDVPPPVEAVPQPSVAVDKPVTEEPRPTTSQSRSQSQSMSQSQSTTQPASQSVANLVSQTSSQAVTNTDRATSRVTSKIVEEAKELLRLFGIPYIDAAGEAEAQCALLESLKLTEGTITDDSDIWLFGAKNVYRYFFSDDKWVMQYKMSDIEFHIRMTRENLVCFAMLVGSDYTDGIMNVGPVTALEILSEFPGDDISPLAKYKEFMDEYRAQEAPKRVIGGDIKKRRKLLKFELPDEFPSQSVYDGYMRPVADSSSEEFSWGLPDLDQLREYARRNFAWDSKRIDEKLLPVMKKLSEKSTQPTIDSFFFKTAANQDPERFRSKRVNAALKKISNKSGGGSSQETQATTTAETDETSKGKKRKSPKRKAKGQGTSGRTKTTKKATNSRKSNQQKQPVPEVVCLSETDDDDEV